MMQSQKTTIDSEQTICDSNDAETLFTETLKVLGDFWVLRIISALASNPQRFCELERTLKNSNPVTLTKKLKKLEENGFIVRRTDACDRQSVNYGLTEKGYDTLPVISEIKRFSLSRS